MTSPTQTARDLASLMAPPLSSPGRLPSQHRRPALAIATCPRSLGAVGGYSGVAVSAMLYHYKSLWPLVARISCRPPFRPTIITTTLPAERIRRQRCRHRSCASPSASGLSLWRGGSRGSGGGGFGACPGPGGGAAGLRVFNLPLRDARHPPPRHLPPPPPPPAP